MKSFTDRQEDPESNRQMFGDNRFLFDELTFYGRTFGQSGDHLRSAQSASLQHPALAAPHFLLDQMVIARNLDSPIGLLENQRMVLENEPVAERAVTL